MRNETILVKEARGILTVTFNRPKSKNSINGAFLRELNDALDLSLRNSECRMVVLEGQNGVFSTGMDFNDRASGNYDEKLDRLSLVRYMEMLKRFREIPRIVISIVDGQVIAGGVGLVAASDLVIATPRARFGLSEALWGMLPGMLLPFLIRRVGFQKAYSMTLTTMPVSAVEAHSFNLVDEVTETPDQTILQLTQRLIRLEESTIENIKQFFLKLWPITGEFEEMAVAESFRLMNDPKVRENIDNFVRYKKFPWNK
ncbi:MAG: hypothetical protein JL50_19380 [Peptococcaceae bacterium BICA1-7]|nr:MAG: hypothetical protein JL50_19380 [Peptococcaceae bacterium BICA1-7]HBV98897.1 enoyl-CoA hydratase [Desulfotomaculum sp.]